MAAPIETDVVIVGAGPVGLFAVFELGLYDLKCHLIDILDRPGGQCTELYPDKPIYDIPACPEISAQALVDRLVEQIAPFSPEFHFNRMVSGFRKLDNGRFEVETDEGELFHCHAVVIAAGGGPFQSKRLSVPGIEAYEGKGVCYSVRRMEDFRDRDLVIVGGSESALDWALSLQPFAKSVTLVHLRPDFRAVSDSVSKMFALRDEGKIRFLVGEVTSLKGEDGQLGAATITGPDGEFDIACDRLLPFLGRTMKPGPIADWGFNLHENLVPVDTETFETSIPGVFAIGDTNWYPGKLKLILSGFHEAALMTQAVKRIVNPKQRPVFQYTTSSTSLQKKLGVQ